MYPDPEHPPDEERPAEEPDGVGAARPERIPRRGDCHGEERIVPGREHRHQEPFGAQRHQGRGEKAQGEEGRLAVTGEELLHGAKVPEGGGKCQKVWGGGGGFR